MHADVSALLSHTEIKNHRRLQCGQCHNKSLGRNVSEQTRTTVSKANLHTIDVQPDLLRSFLYIMRD